MKQFISKDDLAELSSYNKKLLKTWWLLKGPMPNDMVTDGVVEVPLNELKIIPTLDSPWMLLPSVGQMMEFLYEYKPEFFAIKITHFSEESRMRAEERGEGLPSFLFLTDYDRFNGLPFSNVCDGLWLYIKRVFEQLDRLDASLAVNSMVDSLNNSFSSFSSIAPVLGNIQTPFQLQAQITYSDVRV